LSFYVSLLVLFALAVGFVAAGLQFAHEHHIHF
jgi:hypothetical protein